MVLTSEHLNAYIKELQAIQTLNKTELIEDAMVDLYFKIDNEAMASDKIKSFDDVAPKSQECIKQISQLLLAIYSQAYVKELGTCIDKSTLKHNTAYGLFNTIDGTLRDYFHLTDHFSFARRLNRQLRPKSCNLSDNTRNGLIKEFSFEDKATDINSSVIFESDNRI
ncbi:hypothetical protein [Facilibium subflavum]|uniref:hypothetical protein n=1 Tax=Facilibium subflavum TaxID=2219058 RepID=UPI000E65BA7B|nr:hypothetical protein [Facilibium subflavum]